MKIATKLTLLGAGALFLTACDNQDPDSTKNQFWYSNPTAQALTLKIDGQDHTLEPGKAAMLKLSPGMHKMQNSKGHQQDFMVYENNSGGIINPDNHIYYMLAEVYAGEGKSDRFKPALYENTINGYTFELPLRSANAVVIDHNLFNCSYPVGEAFPVTARRLAILRPSALINLNCWRISLPSMAKSWIRSRMTIRELTA